MNIRSVLTPDSPVSDRTSGNIGIVSRLYFIREVFINNLPFWLLTFFPLKKSCNSVHRLWSESVPQDRRVRCEGEWTSRSMSSKFVRGSLTDRYSDSVGWEVKRWQKKKNLYERYFVLNFTPIQFFRGVITSGSKGLCLCFFSVCISRRHFVDCLYLLK